MRASQDLINRVKREAAGLKSHAEKESLAMELGSAAAGEPLALLECNRGGMVAWLEREPGLAPRNPDLWTLGANRRAALASCSGPAPSATCAAWGLR